MPVSSVTSAPGWGAVAGTKDTRKVAPVTTAAPTWSGVSGAAPTAPAPTPPSSYVGPTTSTGAAPASTYNMNVPGASEGLYGAIAPALANGGYAEAYANAPAYQYAQQSTRSNQLLDAYGNAIAQPTAFEGWAQTTPAPDGALYGMIMANQGQVTGTSDLMNYVRNNAPQTGNIQNTMASQAGQVNGPNDVLNLGRYGTTDGGQGDAAFGATSRMVTDPTRIGGYMSNTGAYSGAAQEGTGLDTANRTEGLVAGNTLGRFAADPNGQYRTSSGATAAEREMAAAGQSMASGVDASTASGRYWQDLQSNPTALPDGNLDAYYDRQRLKAQQDIDKMMAARGLFGSSASSDASREMMLDLAGQQVKAESDYSLAAALARNDISSGAARNADEAGLSRYVARNDAARGVDTAALGLSRLGLDARAQQDQNALERYRAQNDVAQGVDAGARDLYLGRGDLMNRSDATDTARFSEYNQAANALDQTDIDAYNARSNALDAGGRLDVDRYNAGINASNLADRVGIDSYATRADALRDAGQLDVNRFNANADAVSAADRTNLDRYVAQGDTLARGADTMLDRYRALTEGATAADNASRSLYTAGSDVMRGADQSMMDRYGRLIDSAGQADLSRTGRAQIANESQYNYTSMLDSILNSGYGDMIGSDEELISLITQLGLGSAGANLQGALAHQGAVGDQGAQLQQIGAQADATNRQIIGAWAGGK